MSNLQKLLGYIKGGYDYEFDWCSQTGVVYLIVQNPEYKKRGDNPNLVAVLVEKT
jgi:hypothetical protein